MRFIIVLIPLIIGCNSDYDIVVNAYNDLCNRNNNSVSCTQSIDTLYSPDKEYLDSISSSMYGNFNYISDKEQYGVSEYWFDNLTVYDNLYGDCDDISLTFISQMINDGVNPENIRFVASGIDGKLKHYYVMVKMDNGEYYKFYSIDDYDDIMYMQYNNIGIFIKENE